MMQLNQPTAGVPKRVILPYAGLIADIPTGWFLCNGSNGTPDLTDSFILGGTEAQTGQTGGSQAVTPSGSVSTGISGGVSTGISGGVSAGISGGVSVNNHTLSSSQSPAHNHYNYRIRGNVRSAALGGSASMGYGTGYYLSQASGPNSGATNYKGRTQNSGSSGSHGHGVSHNLSVSASHSLSASSSHNISASSGFSGASQDNRPKFYKAAYIMYVG